MNASKLISTFLLVLAFGYDVVKAAETSCEDWEPYKEEKCFKVFDKVGLQSFEDAEKTCKQQDNTSRLVSITFREEQEFLVDFLFKKSKIVDNVWIGAKYNTDKKFKWEDNSELIYTNWAEKSPKNLTDYCVQMHSEVDSLGKWVDEPCKKKNLVVCQKRQTWSLSRLQDILLEVKLNPVPIGFVYVQLPSEKAPTEIWPWMTWNDVSATYAGVFFRVSGGDAASFGQVQNDNAPHVINVESVHSSYLQGKHTITKGQTSDAISTGSNGDGLLGIKVEMSGGEVRPRNMAIRVWKRTA